MSQPKLHAFLQVIKENCASVSNEIGAPEMQKSLLENVAQVVSHERAFASHEKASIQPEVNNVVFDFGTKIADKAWLEKAENNDLA
jgi:hypothetical protein